MDRNKLVGDAHSIAKTSGWWTGDPRSLAECAMLAISEIAEATECVRSGEPPLHLGRVGKVEASPGAGVVVEAHGGKEYVMEYQGVLKPEGELIELADCAIRIADFFGYVDANLDLFVKNAKQILIGSETLDSLLFLKPLEQHAEICLPLALAAKCSRLDHRKGEFGDSLRQFGEAFALIELICDYRKLESPIWDLEKAINMKMAYNATRSFRHDNKLA